MTDETDRFKRTDLTKGESAVQARLVDVVFDTLIGAMGALKEDGCGGQRAASLAVNGAVRGIMLFTTSVYASGIDHEDHEKMGVARKNAKDFVQTVFEHACESADRYHRRRLN